jgi:hypothetical protein
MKEAGDMPEFRAEYARGGRRKSADSLHLSAASLGQNCPPCCPQEKPQAGREEFARDNDTLGQPLSISDVAQLIGVSAWTVRQRYLRAGIPFVRLGPRGKLIFYKNQIINWMLDEQRKGGLNP